MLWQLQPNPWSSSSFPAKSLPADFSTDIVEIFEETAAVGTAGPGHDSQAPAPGSQVRFLLPAAVRLAGGGSRPAVGGSVLYYFSGTIRRYRPQIAVK